MKYKQVQLQDICSFLSGGTPDTKVKEYWQGDIPWITGADIQDGRIIEPREYITPHAIKKSATNIIPRRSVILATRTGVGKVAINDLDICISQDFTALIPDSSKLMPEFLYYGIQANRRYLHRYQRGATIQGVTREVVRRLSLPLPPLPEQKRIAAILGKADRLRRLRRYVRELSDTFLQSVFLEMFGETISNPMGWSKLKLDKLAVQIDYGITAPANSDPVGPQMLRITDIQRGRVNWEEVPFCEISEDEAVKGRLHKNDIVFARTGATTGKSFLIEDCPRDSVFASYLIRVRPGNDVDPYYLYGFFQSGDYWHQIAASSIGSAQEGVNSTKLRNLIVPLPNHRMQLEYRKIYIEFQLFLQRQFEAERQGEHLFQSLLHRAFRGEV